MTSLRRILSDYRDAYVRAILAIGLNAAIIGLLLLPGLRGIRHAAVTVVYLVLLVLGYYALIPLLVITLVFSLSVFTRRLAVPVSGLVLALLVYYFAVDSVLFNIFKFHLDAFWILHIFTDFDTMGVPLSAVIAAIVLLLMAGALQFASFTAARRIRRPGRAALGLVAAILLSFTVSQAIHIVAYERNQGQITALTPRLPLYYPLTWHRQATKYGGLLSWALGPAQTAGSREPLSFRYPLRPLDCAPTSQDPPPNIVVLLVESWRYDAMDAAVSPNMWKLAGRSSTFLRHFSSGNSTPAGVFGLFYGIHPTYWTAIKAQSAAVGNPVLIELLQSRGYALGIYSEHFERHKIADTIFRGIAVHDSFAGASPDARDADMTSQLEAFVSDAARRHQPFMAFEFFKSTHYAYYYPPGDAPFQPARKLNVAMAGDRGMIAAYLNDYRNAVHYVDELVGDVIRHLDDLGLMNNTIVVVTGDHSEEFNDDGAGYWGHASNFTQYQTRVPLVMYVPGQRARRVTTATTHVDVATTLIQAICGSAQDARQFSNGMNLFQALPNERPLVVSSYVNHAFILGEDVYSVFPMYVQRYRLDDVNAAAGRPAGDQMRDAMEEITRFSGGRSMLAHLPASPPADGRVTTRAAAVTGP